MASVTSDDYSICGVGVRVECQDPYQGENINSLWQRLFTLGKVDASAQYPAILLQFKPPGHAVPPSAAGEEVWRSSGLRLLKTKDGFYIRCGSSILDLDLSASRAVGILHDEFWRRSLQDQREFFLLSFVLLLGQHGLFGLHANGVAKGGTGFLIAGASGCGKPTLTLS